MKRPVAVGPLAEREAKQVARWYERLQAGLGQAFLIELLAAFDAIEAEPESFPILRAPYRRKLLDRFPYAVIYKVTPTRVHVRAVAHGRRRPGYWAR